MFCRGKTNVVLNWGLRGMQAMHAVLGVCGVLKGYLCFVTAFSVLFCIEGMRVMQGILVLLGVE